MTRILRNAVVTTLGAVGTSALMLMALNYGPKLEASLLPVAGNFEINDVVVDENSIEFKLVSEQFRKSCKISSIMFLGFKKGRWQYLPANLIEDGRYVTLAKNVSALRGNVSYRCPFEPWLSIVRFGPVVLPEDKS